MEAKGHVCPSCGHLSPATWADCHNCSNDLDEDDARSVAEITNYYAAIEAGYGRYAVVGYLIAVASVLFLFVLGVIVDSLNSTGLIESIIAVLVLLALVSLTSGLSLLFGSKLVLQSAIRQDETVPVPGLGKVVAKGFGELVIAGIVLGIISVIPVVNTIVALILTLLVLASPWLIYNSYSRYQVGRPEAVRSLLDRVLPPGRDTAGAVYADTSSDSSQANGGEVSMADFLDDRSGTARTFGLEVLASASASTVNAEERDLLVSHLRSDPDTAYALVEIDPFVGAVATTHEDATYSHKAEILDRLLELGEIFRDDRRFDAALRCYETAEALVSRFGMEKYEGDVAAALEQTSNAAASARFSEVSDELRDTVRSAEGAQAAGDHETAVKRYLDAEARLPGQFYGDPELEAEYQELVDRLEAGMAAAMRDLILSVLPDSPNDIERKLLAANLPAAIGSNLNDIYDDELDEAAYRELFNEYSIDDVDQATTPLTTYRNAKRRLQAAVDEPGPYIGRLDSIVNAALDANNQPELRAGKAVDSSRTAVTPGRTYARIVERLSELEADTSNPAFADCLDAIRTALRDRQMLRSQADLDQAKALVDRIEPIEVYVDTFPSLSIDAILEEITASIESGTGLAPGHFTREFDRIDRLVEGEGEQLAQELEMFLNEWQGHPAIDQTEWRRAISEARDADDPKPLLEPYRTMQRMEGTVWERTDLQRFSWEAFEQLIANLYSQQGYETTVTSGSRDMGVDVWAENDTERLAIQVKQFARGNTVGREVIQKLESNLARGDADRTVVVTSSSFADTARRYAMDSSKVELIDGGELIEKLTRYEVPVPESTM